VPTGLRAHPPPGPPPLRRRRAPDIAIMCTPDGRAVTTLSSPRTRHLYQLFRTDLKHRTFEEEVYHLISKLGSRSEIRFPTFATTTRNRWATHEDLLPALRTTFHIQT
jgi:hypothetical protein